MQHLHWENILLLSQICLFLITKNATKSIIESYSLFWYAVLTLNCVLYLLMFLRPRSVATNILSCHNEVLDITLGIFQIVKIIISADHCIFITMN